MSVTEELKRTRKRVKDNVAEATARTWPGTRAIVADLVHQSKYQPSWRPVRAAAVLAQADLKPRVWMTAEEFTRWRRECRAVRRQRGLDFSVLESIGVGWDRSTALAKGKAPIPKTTALACAHVFFGMEPPIVPGDFAAFAEWFAREFGAARGIAGWLAIRERGLTDRLRGFRIRDGRFPIEPDIGLIRALDWVLRCGPYCPYGDRPAVEVFPRTADTGLTALPDTGS